MRVWGEQPSHMSLKRVAANEYGVFGVLMESRFQLPFALTLEPVWEDNKKNRSCIPSGCYPCKRIISPKFGETFEIQEVHERTDILFHWGNVDDDTKGCILLGEEFGILDHEPAILSSQRAFDEFMSKLADRDRFILEIRWV